MKLITFISAGAFIFSSAFVMKNECTTQASSLYDKKWELKKIHNISNVEEITGNAFIRFNQGKKSAGGNGGCNAFGSTITVSGNAISLKEIISTQMYCEGVQPTEIAFFKLLEKVNQFVVKDKSLVLYYDKDILLEFENN